MNKFDEVKQILDAMVADGVPLRKAINDVIIDFHKVLTPDECQDIWNLCENRNEFN